MIRVVFSLTWSKPRPRVLSSSLNHLARLLSISNISWSPSIAYECFSLYVKHSVARLTGLTCITSESTLKTVLQILVTTFGCLTDSSDKGLAGLHHYRDRCISKWSFIVLVGTRHTEKSGEKQEWIFHLRMCECESVNAQTLFPRHFDECPTHVNEI